MAPILLAGHNLVASDIHDKTSIASAYPKQPVANVNNSGNMYLKSTGSLEDFIYNGTVTHTSTLSTIRDTYWSSSYYGDDFFIDAEITIESLGETKVVDNYVRSTGEFRVSSAFTSTISTNTPYILRIPVDSREFIVEIVDAGVPGDATFKWTHDGTNYWGIDKGDLLDEPYTFSKIEFEVNDFMDSGRLSRNDAAFLCKGPGGSLYLCFKDYWSNYGYVLKSIDNGLSWSRIDTFSFYYGAIGFFVVTKGAYSGRILLYYLKYGGAWWVKYSDDDGVNWADADLGYDVQDETKMDVCHGDDNKIYMVYQYYGTVYVRSTTDGVNLSSRTTVSTTDYNYDPAICYIPSVGSNGRFVVTFINDSIHDYIYEVFKVYTDDLFSTFSTEEAIMEFEGVGNASMDTAYYDTQLIIDPYDTVMCVSGWKSDSRATFNFDYVLSENNGYSFSSPATLFDPIENSDTANDNPQFGDGTWMVEFLDSYQLLLGYKVYRQYSDYDITFLNAIDSYIGDASTSSPIETTNNEAQNLICGLNIIPTGMSADSGDKWTIEYDSMYNVTNILADDSPSIVWKSESSATYQEIILDLGAYDRLIADTISLFNCNFASCTLELNSENSWASPSLTKVVDFTIATGEVESITINAIKDTSLLQSYDDHEFKAKKYRLGATTGYYKGYSWEIIDNVGDHVLLNTDSTIYINSGDTFAIFSPSTYATFSETVARWARLVIPKQNIFDIPSEDCLYGYWAFSAGSGSVAEDQSGNDRDGEFYSNATWDEDGIITSAYYSVSTLDAGVTLLTHDEATFASDVFTLSWWTYATTEVGESSARLMGRDCSDYWCVCLQQDESFPQDVQLYLESSSHAVNDVISSGWNHLALMVDKRTSSAAEFYVNGELEGEYDSADFGAISARSRPLVMGCNTESSPNGNNTFMGKMDEVRMYHTKLVKNEIRALYNYPHGDKPDTFQYQIGHMIIGKRLDVTRNFNAGYKRMHDMGYAGRGRYDDLGYMPIKITDPTREYSLTWRNSDTSRKEIINTLKYLKGRNICFIPDDEPVLTKVVGDLKQIHIKKFDNFDLSITLREVK